MKVLIIEDDPFFQKFYSTKLVEKGCEVAVASDGEEGLEKLAAGKPDIVLLDLIMPKKDGFSVLQSLSGKQHPPVLVFSTLGSEEDISSAMKTGAVGYINKGVSDFENSFAKISSVVGK